MEHTQQHIRNEKSVLAITSLTEFGERYCYYLIQGLLIFLLIEHFGITQAKSDVLVGTVLSVIYISAIVGGYVADKILGYYNSALLGAIFMILGNFILALSSSENMLFLGLACVSLSSGLIKSNMSSFIGHFYDKAKLSDSHRDFGFNIFYVGINLGAFLALVGSSWLKDKYGFLLPFYSSVGVAVLILVNLIVGIWLLKDYVKWVPIGIKNLLHLVVCLSAYIAVVFFVLSNPFVANIAIYVAALAAIFVLLKSAQGNWGRVIVAAVFFAFSILYWALYFQEFISILLFLKYTVNHHFYMLNIGSSQFVSIDNLMVIIMGFAMGKLWVTRANAGKPVHDIDKFNLGFILIAVMFVLFYFSCILGDMHAKVPAIVFIVGFSILAISELSLSAIGLSCVTKIAPKGYVSLYMGIWLVTLGIGGKIAGLLSQYITISPDIYSSRVQMAHGFILFIGLSIIGSIGCLLVRKTMIRMSPQK